MGKMVYYTNGEKEKRFLENEEIPDGWHKGRLKPCATTCGKMWVNNGTSEIFCSPQEIPIGYTKGRLPKSEVTCDKVRQSLLSRNFRHYNNGSNEILLSVEDEIPYGYELGRLPMSREQKRKISDSHIGKKHTEETKKKISCNSNNNRAKARQTCMKKYGVPSVMAVDSIREKAEETKRRNGTFNTSKPEDNYYEYLKSKYGCNAIKRNYKSTEYPFRCDFYVIPIDMYIECNYHWTHGGREFDPNDEDCLNQLRIWEEKSKTSEFYRQAIITWTIRDVEKIRWAKEHNLNYKILYQFRNC